MENLYNLFYILLPYVFIAFWIFVIIALVWVVIKLTKKRRQK
jgi:hypothetical protein